MYDIAVLIAQILALGAIAAWLTTGVWDNILYPENNEAYTAQVVEMTRLREAYPEEYARVAHRAVQSRTTQQAMFRLVVAAELLATLVMWAGVAALALHLFGVTAAGTARAIALLGAALFTSVWAGFLVVGNYFCYWFCHEWGQNTHFQMTLWGLGTMIFLVAA